MERDQRAQGEVIRAAFAFAFAFAFVVLIAACDRERPAPSAPPAPPQPDVAAPRPDAAPAIRDDEAPGHLASEGSAQPMDDMFGPACTRGNEDAPHTLPFPVSIPAGTYIASWCRDGDAFFYARGTKAAEGKLVGGRPDGAWTYYRETGERLLSGRYINGEADDLWRAYDPGGKVTQLGCFRAGKKRWGVTGDKSTDAC